jgi:hypothetical protein
LYYDCFFILGIFPVTYTNLFTLKIHHSVEFSNPPYRVYKFAWVDYVDLIDYEEFFVHELDKVLGELVLDDDGKSCLPILGSLVTL